MTVSYTSLKMLSMKQEKKQIHKQINTKSVNEKKNHQRKMANNYSITLDLEKQQINNICFFFYFLVVVNFDNNI